MRLRCFANGEISRNKKIHRTNDQGKEDRQYVGKEKRERTVPACFLNDARQVDEQRSGNDRLEIIKWIVQK